MMINPSSPSVIVVDEQRPIHITKKVLLPAKRMV